MPTENQNNINKTKHKTNGLHWFYGVSLYIFLKIYLFWEGVEGEGERVPSRHRSKYGAQQGARCHNPEIMSSAGTEIRTLNQPFHPRAPRGKTIKFARYR